MLFKRSLNVTRYFRLIHSNFPVYHVKLLNDFHGEVDLANKEFWGLNLPIPMFFKLLNFYKVTHFLVKIGFTLMKKKKNLIHYEILYLIFIINVLLKHYIFI